MTKHEKPKGSNRLLRPRSKEQEPRDRSSAHWMQDDEEEGYSLPFVVTVHVKGNISIARVKRKVLRDAGGKRTKK